MSINMQQHIFTICVGKWPDGAGGYGMTPTPPKKNKVTKIVGQSTIYFRFKKAKSLRPFDLEH